MNPKQPPGLGNNGLFLVKTLPTALTCWPYRNTRRGACRGKSHETQPACMRTSRSRRLTTSVRERKTTLARAERQTYTKLATGCQWHGDLHLESCFIEIDHN